MKAVILVINGRWPVEVVEFDLGRVYLVIK